MKQEGQKLGISRKDARRLAVIHQGLHSVNPFGSGKNAVTRMVDQLGYVQIDTISVVERAHHHVIATRVPNYQKNHLLELQLRHRDILEYWSHAAAFIPMSDYRFTIPIQEHFRKGNDAWPDVDRQVKAMVYDRIKSEGPLMSRDFERSTDKKGDGWWDWKPAKLALQRLFFEGSLMVSHRKGFQRVYDLPERVIPSHINTSSPSTEEYADYLIEKYLKAHGIGTQKSMSYLRKGMGPAVASRLKERLISGDIIEIDIKGVNSRYYAISDIESTLRTRITRQLHILSPFDNLVIQRERTQELFDFDYQIECYVPKDKRVHGYFVLPLLIGDKFVGRMDAKADRKSGKFNIKYLGLEPKVDEDEFVEKFVPALQGFVAMNGCDDLGSIPKLPFRDKLLRMYS